MADVRDVMGRIASHLTRQETEHRLACDEAVIVVAAEILPSQALAFDRAHVAGILTETGGTTGHAAILARYLGIPPVSGLRGILRDVYSAYLANQIETTPFMGCRRIRLRTEHSEFLQTQLRAILRAEFYGRVSLLFPMISNLEEVHRLKSLVAGTQAALQRQGIAQGQNI